MTITAFRVRHNIPCYGYKVEIARAGRFDADRAKAAGIPLKFWNPLQKGRTVEAEGMVYTPEMVLGPPRRGLKVVYTTDTRPTEDISRHANAADLFICEGMYGEPDSEKKAREHRHMTMQEAARLARAADPRQMWLTHYSPSMMRPELFMDSVRAIFPRAIAAKDGQEANLRFEDEE